MNDSYQAIYDATRSRIGHVNGGELIEAIASRFDISQSIEILRQDFFNVAYEQQRPSTLHRPSLQIDGNCWCALYGVNLQEGVAGFGKSPALAMDDFDKNWTKALE